MCAGRGWRARLSASVISRLCLYTRSESGCAFDCVCAYARMPFYRNVKRIPIIEARGGGFWLYCNTLAVTATGGSLPPPLSLLPSFSPPLGCLILPPSFSTHSPPLPVRSPFHLPFHRPFPRPHPFIHLPTHPSTHPHMNAQTRHPRPRLMRVRSHTRANARTPTHTRMRTKHTH